MKLTQVGSCGCAANKALKGLRRRLKFGLQLEQRAYAPYPLALRNPMARVPLLDDTTNPELAELVAKLRAGRRGDLINVYRLLLHSPPLAESWFEHSNAVRWKTELDGRLRELVIVRIAQVSGVDYIVHQHVPKLTEPEGITEADLMALSHWRLAANFDERERAALGLADVMTRDIEVPDATYNEVAKHFTPRQIVELVVLIGAYNMNTRVLTALQIDPQTPTTDPQTPPA
jgi:4-carboxymuconolactone decarboxylase